MAKQKKSIIEQFREFAIKGNALDLAVGVIIGAAFGKITDSLVKDIIMPPLGLILGKIDFSNKYVLLGPGQTVDAQGNVLTVAQAQKLGPVLAYGQFINNVISFLIVAFAVFMLVKLAKQNPPGRPKAARTRQGRSQRKEPRAKRAHDRIVGKHRG